MNEKILIIFMIHLGVGSGSETDSIDEDGVENYTGINGEEIVRTTKDLSSGDRLASFSEEELEKAKRRKSRRRKQSDPPPGHSIGSIFKDNHGNLE